MNDHVQKTLNSLKLKDELIQKQDEYIEFLRNIMNKKEGFLYAHNIFDSKEDIQLGQQLRDQMLNIKTKIKENE